MNAGLCVGVEAGSERLELVLLGAKPRMCHVGFPSNSIGWAAVRGFLAGHHQPVRIAVAGVAALGFALAVGNAQDRRVLIVAPTVVKSALELALHAKNNL